MKQIAYHVLVVILLSALTFNIALARQTDEAVIKSLDNLEREAVLKGDTAALFNKFWSPNIVINTPANRVGTVETAKASLRAGKLNYASFERVIEKITFTENIAIVMGYEVIKPQGASDHAGKTVTRRYTNIWMTGKDGWQMVARQATIIKVE
ncbi:nuclear transport factor 2 family protein [Chitinophaga ginsengisegetis]|uniref:nuclear transport factor 2 family protein n=1 Tax=Chitinophaga ginsengisegetis TaxID=393003 RepID=UPI000DBA1E7A|nr:nuclear transport factor 2 family protein [Chitinophaga ginsengisegetis]MDR6565632.1 ketosteroid isomerase-like protein [Chitinophaga ginsengisegetis]MDR6645361.1 ketosteroid isomerase-like protein [Chitinophaga ginsengisegetis]MDR6652048.1 ketosteroid isomerase-like protein [Chitinophaga ginsengisegetis]